MAFPRLSSADDHVVEPPHLWTERLPAKLRDAGPYVRREKVAKPEFGLHLETTVDDDGQWADVWHYEDKAFPLLMLGAAVGFDHTDVEFRTVTYDEIRPGCFQPEARLADMDAANIEASLCFPNLQPVRFAGQGFLEAKDKKVAELCVQAYNDFVLDEWCAKSEGRLIPCGIVPLWDVNLAVAEVKRVAARGMKALSFSEAPAHLGLPSLHAGYWDPFFAACEQVGVIIALHIGSSSRLPLPSPDAPGAEANLLLANNASTALVDWLCSGHFVTYPNLKVLIAESQIGWAPYFLERLDFIWKWHVGWNGITHIPEPPSSYFRRNVYLSFFNDYHGLKSLGEIGVDNVLFETDYPHSDSTWPNCQSVAQDLAKSGELTDEQIEKVFSGNARRLFGLPNHREEPASRG